MLKDATNMSTNMHVNTFPSGTWNCIPSPDRTTVHSESATEFTSGFPSDIQQEIMSTCFHNMDA